MLTEFYQIVSIKENEGILEARIKLNEKHPIFAGHFPGQPVVPGVCMVQIVKELLEGKVKKKLNVSQAKNIKFLAMLDPVKQREVNIQIEHRVGENGFEVNAKIFDGDITFFKLESSIFLTE